MPDTPVQDTNKPGTSPKDETLTVEEALRRTFVAGPMPGKRKQRTDPA